MKKLFVVCILLFLSGCASEPTEYQDQATTFKVYGSSTSNSVWVYLCGLTADFIPVIEYDGGHEIPESVLYRLLKTLN